MGKADRLREKKQAMLDEEAVGKPTLTITIEVDAKEDMRVNGPGDFITFTKMMARALDVMTDKAHKERIEELKLVKSRIEELKPENKRIITKIH